MANTACQRFPIRIRADIAGIAGTTKDPAIRRAAWNCPQAHSSIKVPSLPYP